MPAQFIWDDDNHTIVRIAVSSRWTWAEFNTTFDAFLQAANGTSNRMDVIWDRRESTRLPVNSLGETVRVFRNLPPNVQLVVMVGRQVWLQILVDMVSRVYPHVNTHMAHVATLEAARELIRQQRDAKNGP
jgi:hypothetical protein